MTVKRWRWPTPPFAFTVTRYVTESRVRTTPFVGPLSPPGRSSGLNGPAPSARTSIASPTCGRPAGPGGAAVAGATVPIAMLSTAVDATAMRVVMR
ncbi:hypothetical protein DEJ25_14850 [Curtobacterium sp. MCPF17_011]|nr:hypothetical protein DEI89_10330 [Curtobacterium sp. MCBD17_030]PZE35062.1 hypothetical protein DEJ31_13460 [Curtobacterium sp. MCPF17_031]PZF09375.1 hypothetical protein DEJ25_14850 [Curtobacterium sp. MCPF17_011]